MATLGRMAAGIAHEIRNPLASIAGSVKLLQSISRLDDDQSKLIEIVSMSRSGLINWCPIFCFTAVTSALNPRKWTW